MHSGGRGRGIVFRGRLRGLGVGFIIVVFFLAFRAVFLPFLALAKRVFAIIVIIISAITIATIASASSVRSKFRSLKV